MAIVDVFAIGKRERVLRDTWGHLAPEPGQKYTGTILLAQGDYGDNVILSARFDELDDSPWLFEDMQEFIWSVPDQRPAIFKWSGWYVRYKNGNHRFGGGKFRKLQLPD